MSEFIHKHTAHCESGAVSALITHAGLPISEAMCFGLSSALIFGYFPFVKINSLPLISYRMPPRFILKGISKSIGVEFEIKSFKNDKTKASTALDTILQNGGVAGVQTSVFYLPYFPKDMQFHFNAHNLVVFKKEGDTYFISDPVFDYVNTIKESNLLKARFAKGVLAPHGAMYTVKSLPKNINFEKSIKKSISKTVSAMLKTPLPIIGIWGMMTMAKKLSSLKIRTSKELRYAKLFISQLIRMQEEIGTGGGGFRFMYASFLQESGNILNQPILLEASQMMSEAGDRLRYFALSGAKMIKEREELDLSKLSEIFRDCALSEEKVYKKLKDFK
jgi:hypothetical protein